MSSLQLSEGSQWLEPECKLWGYMRGRVLVHPDDCGIVQGKERHHGGQVLGTRGLEPSRRQVGLKTLAYYFLPANT